MKKFAINAYEGIYGGLHGMNDKFVIECESREEAVFEAEAASRDVMESYDCIWNDLEECASEVGYDEYDEYNEPLEQLIEENICYEIYEIESDLSIEELTEMAYNDFDELIMKFSKDKY